MRSPKASRAPRKPQPAGRAALLGIFAVALTVLLAPHSDGAVTDGTLAPKIDDMVTHVTDLTATLHVTKYEPDALDKIGGDFRQTYSLSTLKLEYKPDKLRLEGHSATRGPGLLILNGSVRFYSLQRLHLKNREDLASKPGKRQSLLEFGGVVAPETLKFMNGAFVKQDTLEGHAADVFDLTYQGEASGSHFRVWIDPITHITERREWFDSTNKLRATFDYSDPKELAPGVWLPCKLDVRTSDGAIAAEIVLEDPKLGQNLPDSDFDIQP